MALTKITGQVINDTTGLVVGVTTVGGGVSATDGFFSGIITATGPVSISTNLTVGGSLSVGGTITYEDVTNIDAVGLVTARNGVVVGSGITLSKDGDIFATGVTTSTTFVGNLTGNVTGNSDTATTATNSTNASHVLVTDNESTNENNLITFVEDATSSTGNVGLEMDGNLTYNPSTGTVSATAFSGSGANLTNLPAANLTGTLPAIDGSNLTGVASINWQSSIKTSNFSASANEGYWINTTSNTVTVTFPSSASVGDTIELVDFARTWGTNKIIIDSNGLNYQGQADTYNVEYDTSGQALRVVYSGATKGWIPTSDEVSENNPTPPPYSVDFLVIAGGGGGGGHSGAPGFSAGGGGAGGYNGGADGSVGSSNTGGGGGGGNGGDSSGGAGGSGIVILRMATSNYSGTTSGSPSVTTSGSDTILTFTGSGTYTA